MRVGAVKQGAFARYLGSRFNPARSVAAVQTPDPFLVCVCGSGKPAHGAVCAACRERETPPPEPEAEPVAPSEPSLEAQRALAAADLARYWREAGYHVTPVEPPARPPRRPVHYRFVGSPAPIAPVAEPRRGLLGDVRVSPVRWRAIDERACLSCGRVVHESDGRCRGCGGRAVG